MSVIWIFITSQERITVNKIH